MRGKIRWFFPKFSSLLGEPFYYGFLFGSLDRVQLWSYLESTISNARSLRLTALQPISAISYSHLPHRCDFICVLEAQAIVKATAKSRAQQWFYSSRSLQSTMAPTKPGGRPKIAWTSSRKRKLVRLYLLTSLNIHGIQQVLSAIDFTPRCVAMLA